MTAIQNFEVRLVATTEDEVENQRIELTALSNAVVGWSDDDYEREQEEDEHADGFLIPDDVEEDEEDGEEGDEEESDMEPEGCLTLQVDLTAAAFAEYRNVRDSEADYTITATIVYKDANGVPVYHHEYECFDGMRLIQTGDDDDRVGSLRLELQGDYYDCIQFAVIDAPTLQ